MGIGNKESGVFFVLDDESTLVSRSSHNKLNKGLGVNKKSGEDVSLFRIRISSSGQIVLIGDFFPDFWLDDASGKLFYSVESIDGVNSPLVSEMALRSDGVLVGGC